MMRSLDDDKPGFITKLIIVGFIAMTIVTVMTIGGTIRVISVFTHKESR